MSQVFSLPQTATQTASQVLRDFQEAIERINKVAAMGAELLAPINRASMATTQAATATAEASTALAKQIGQHEHILNHTIALLGKLTDMQDRILNLLPSVPVEPPAPIVIKPPSGKLVMEILFESLLVLEHQYGVGYDQTDVKGQVKKGLKDRGYLDFANSQWDRRFLSGPKYCLKNLGIIQDSRCVSVYHLTEHYKGSPDKAIEKIRGATRYQMAPHRAQRISAKKFLDMLDKV